MKGSDTAAVALSGVTCVANLAACIYSKFWLSGAAWLSISSTRDQSLFDVLVVGTICGAFLLADMLLLTHRDAARPTYASAASTKPLALGVTLILLAFCVTKAASLAWSQVNVAACAGHSWRRL